MMKGNEPPGELAVLRRYDYLCVADSSQYAEGRGDYYVRVQRHFTPAIRHEMLTGKLTVSLYSLTPEGKAIQSVVDSDLPDGDKDLQKVAFKLRDYGLTPLLEASRRGGHLRIFHEPLDPRVTTTLLTKVLKITGVEAEVFPKGRGLSCMRAPLSPHPKTGIQYPFLDLDRLTPVTQGVMQQVGYLASFERHSPQQMAEVLAQVVMDAEIPKALPKPVARPVPVFEGKPKVNIMEVVAGDREIKKIGKHFRTVCPFHEDTTPSMVIYPETNTFHCFGCKAHGDGIHYLALKSKQSDGDVMRQLRRRI